VHAEQNNKQANLKMAKNTQANEQTDFRYYDFRPTMQNEFLILNILKFLQLYIYFSFIYYLC